MREAQSSRMKKISIQFAEFLRKLRVAALSIDIVTHHRMTDGAQMDSDLVRPPCLDPNFDERKTAESIYNAVLRMGGTATRLPRRHSCADRGMTAYCQFDRPL